MFLAATAAQVVGFWIVAGVAIVVAAFLRVFVACCEAFVRVAEW